MKKKLFREDDASDQQVKQDKIKEVQDQIATKQAELQALQKQLNDLQSGKAVTSEAVLTPMIKTQKIKNIQDNIKIKQNEIKELQKELRDVQAGNVTEGYVNRDIVKELKTTFKSLDICISNIPHIENWNKESLKDIVNELKWLVQEYIDIKNLDEDGESAAAITTTSMGGVATDNANNKITPAINNNAAYVPKKLSMLTRYGTYTPLKGQKRKVTKESVKYIDNLIDDDKN